MISVHAAARQACHARQKVHACTSRLFFAPAADRKGAFIQPALYEAFGLTVIEAMTCGLPVFATNRGGPAEIIVDEESGFHIDPYHGEQAAERMADFFEQVHDSDEAWVKVSDAALERIRTQ